MVRQKGFTLIEALVVSGIIIMMLGLILPNFKLGQKQFSLRSEAEKLAQALRRAQNMSMSAAPFNCQTGYVLMGYGIFFNIDNPDTYKLMARCSNGQTQDLEKESISLENKIKIKYLKKDNILATSLDVFFYPPQPIVDFGEGINKAEIILSSSETDISVKVNKAGLINVE